MKSTGYTAICRAVVQQRGLAPRTAPVGCTVALVKRPPKPEGEPIDEIDDPHYARQVIEWWGAVEGAAAGLTFRSANRIVFGPAAAWTQATHLAVLDDEGRVLGSGHIQTAPGRTGPDEVSFEATAIQLSFR